MKYRVFCNTSLCIMSVFLSLWYFSLSLSLSLLFILLSFSICFLFALFISYTGSSSLFSSPFLEDPSFSISFVFFFSFFVRFWLALSLSLSLSLERALLIYSDFGFVYASCWLIGFSESACNTRTLPVNTICFPHLR